MRFGYLSQALFRISLVHFWLPFCCSRVCVTFLVLLASQSAAVLWLQLVHIARSTSTGYGSTSQQAELLVKLTPPLPLVQTVSTRHVVLFPSHFHWVGREGETTSPLRASLRLLHVRHEVDHLQFFVTMPKSLIIR